MHSAQFMLAYHFAAIIYTIKPQYHSFGGCFPGGRHIKHLLVPDPANKVPEPAFFSDVIIAGGNRHRQNIANLQWVKVTVNPFNPNIEISILLTDYQSILDILSFFVARSRSAKSGAIRWRHCQGGVQAPAQTNRVQSTVALRTPRYYGQNPAPRRKL